MRTALIVNVVLMSATAATAIARPPDRTPELQKFQALDSMRSNAPTGAMQGWTGSDNTFSLIPFFRSLSQNDPRRVATSQGQTAVGTAAGLGGDYSFWCGAFPAEPTRFAMQRARARARIGLSASTGSSPTTAVMSRSPTISTTKPQGGSTTRT